MINNIESIIAFGMVSFICFWLFVFWTKKKALINFRAWALLTFVINFGLAIRFMTTIIDISTVRFLMIIQFIATVITLWRLWKITDKFIPKSKKREGKKSCIFLARVFGMGLSAKSGGNNSKHIKKRVKNFLNKH